MTNNDFREALNRLGLAQVGAAAQLLGYSERSINRMVSGEQPVPRTVEIILWLLERYEVKPENIPPPGPVTTLKQLEDEFYARFGGPPVAFTRIVREEPDQK